MKKNKTLIKNYATLGAMLLAFGIVSILQRTGATSNLINGQLVPICCWCIMAVSLNLTVGILGELSLGHAGFMSVGAFSGVTACMLLRYIGCPDMLALIVGIIAGGLCAALAGLIIGIPVLRLRGDYLAIVTLAFGQIIMSIFTNIYVGYDNAGVHFSFIDPLEMGEGAKYIIKGPTGMTNITKLSTFMLAFIVLFICVWVVFNLVRSRTGRAIMALRDNYIAAESVGLNITKYKLLVFSISAGMAGMAGVIYSFNLSTVTAGKFDFNQSILVLVYVVLGGLGNIGGSLIATVLLVLLPELLREFSTYRMLVYAIVLILVMLATNNPTIRRWIDMLIGKIRSLFSKSGDGEGKEKKEKPIKAKKVGKGGNK